MRFPCWEISEVGFHDNMHTQSFVSPSGSCNLSLEDSDALKENTFSKEAGKLLV